VDDKRNTDHAWLETVIRHYHDDTGSIFRWTEFKSQPSDAMCYEWVGISQAMPLAKFELDFLVQVRCEAVDDVL
jgi:hypothetical protein